MTLKILRQRLLDGEGIKADKWTTSLKGKPSLIHAAVEDFFKQTNEKRHRGLRISKTKKIEKQMRINLLPGHDMFLLEGHTRQPEKQAKSISKGKGIYFCLILPNKETGRSHVLLASAASANA